MTKIIFIMIFILVALYSVASLGYQRGLIANKSEQYTCVLTRK